MIEPNGKDDLFTKIVNYLDSTLWWFTILFVIAVLTAAAVVALLDGQQ